MIEKWSEDVGRIFYQCTEKAGQTLSGRMNRMKDSVDEMLIAVFVSIELLLSPLVDFATKSYLTLKSSLSDCFGCS